ncbi:MAG: hypothetical protein AB7P20_25660 [Rhizobiaceae bacterium]
MLLLPTGYYLIGGALAVAASFWALAFVRPTTLERYANARWTLWEAPERGRFATSLISFLFLTALVASGFLGSHDPLANPLPLVVWTLLWVGLTLVQGLIGNVWYWLDPWYAPHRLLTGVVPTLRDAPFRLPIRLGYWPAVVLFLAFAWFELIDLAPEDPPRLAAVISTYWLATLSAMLLFGHDEWSRRGEFLSVFFRLIARFGIAGADDWKQDRSKLSLAFPGGRIAGVEALPVSGAIFLLCVLGSVSFDGLSETFLWLGANGINPLEFPGRSAVVGINTAGLALTMLALSAVFFATVWLGIRLAGEGSFQKSAGLLVWSIVPIALAYHFSHYLSALLIDGQYALVALSDPFARGWNLFRMAHAHIEVGIVMGHEAAWLVWNAQAAAIVGGHVLAVVLAHLLALRLHTDPVKAVLSQLPLAALMVAYTLLGLWLLSTPSAA